MATKKVRKSAFVPRVLVRTAIVGVIPACAVACGSSTENSAPAADAGRDAGFQGVAAVAYQAYDSGLDGKAVATTFLGVADAAFRPDSGGAGVDAGFLGVAAVAYRAYDSGAGDGPTDAPADVFHGPIPLAITAYEVGRPKKDN